LLILFVNSGDTGFCEFNALAGLGLSYEIMTIMDKAMINPI